MNRLRGARLGRRTFLRGLGGAAIALPMLEGMRGVEELMLGTQRVSGGEALAASEELPRFFFAMCAPNGTIPRWWYPITEGTPLQTREFTFNKIMRPLERYKEKMVSVRGLDNMATQFSSGCGNNHATAVASWLTGARPRLVATDIWESNALSLDQLIAQRLGADLPYPVLACGTEGSGGTYMNLSSAGPGRQLPLFSGTKPLYQALFGVIPSDPRQAALQSLVRGSVLDGVSEDFSRLKPQLSIQDQQRVSQHLESIREVERRLQLIAQGTCNAPDAATADALQNPGNTLQAKMRAQLDMTLLAMSCGLTCAATYMFAHSGGGSLFFDFIKTFKPDEDGRDQAGRNYEFHELSHINYDGGEFGKGESGPYVDFADPMKVDRLPAYGAMHRWILEQFVYFLDGASQTQLSPDGTTLFDRMLCLYGNELSTGYNHSRKQLPFLLLGDAGGRLKTGRALDYRQTGTQHTHNQLLVSIAQLMGLEDVTEFGNPDLSSGALPELLM